MVFSLCVGVRDLMPKTKQKYWVWLPWAEGRGRLKITSVLRTVTPPKTVAVPWQQRTPLSPSQALHQVADNTESTCGGGPIAWRETLSVVRYKLRGSSQMERNPQDPSPYSEHKARIADHQKTLKRATLR